MTNVKKIVVGALLVSALGMTASYASDAASANADGGYKLVWSDEFNGKALNTKDWNYETHEPGWVNNELQSYGNSKKNTYVKDGNLVIQPLFDGKKYTSGRINTQNKHTITYGKVEVRAKVPAGKGFLPAIWMMPNDENLYGQWPKCGEIDIMEVLGHETKTLYSTLHYGEPHTEGQGSYTLTDGTFANEFHVFGMEWDPGEIRFYVDGKLYHTENDWFTKKIGFGEITYPAPYDQPFYLILNVAVGGNWPGNPDGTTKFDSNAAMYVDYVRLYQKSSYDENVAKPEKKVKFRGADSNGNYVVNGKFNDEDVSKSKNWNLLTAGNGKATASINGNAIHVNTTDAGELDYSVQLVQPGIPLLKGSKYKLSFDMNADSDRTAIVSITAPNVGWIRYLADTKISVGTKKKSYSFNLTMKDSDDPSARLEFNLGNQGSTAGVHISNVRLEKTGEIDLSEVDSCEPDGNYVFNGKFQEGKGRMDFWTTESAVDGIEFGVTNKNNVRELMCDAKKARELSDAKLIQKGLKVAASTEYKLTFMARSDSSKPIQVQFAGETFTVKTVKASKVYSFAFKTGEKLGNTDLVFLLGNGGTTYIDNVNMLENTLLVNGDFSGGLKGYEVYAYTTSDVSYVVDTLNEDSAFCIDIENTGDLDWKIQLKQNDIVLERGGKYKISFDAKCTTDRTIMYALQRDGSRDNNWIPYSGTLKINLTKDFQNFSTTFDMTEKTDEHTILSISMGAVNGKQIKNKHTVVIDNIVLERIK